MIQKTKRRKHSMVLASLVLGVMIFGVFHNSAIFAQDGPVDPILYDGSSGGGGGGGGGWSCPDSDKCGNFGCHERSYTDHTMICSRYNFDGVPFNCSSPVNCTSP